MSMVEKGEIISDEFKLANSFSNLFENAIRSLGIKTNKHSHENYCLKNTVEITFKKFFMKLFISHQQNMRAFLRNL